MLFLSTRGKDKVENASYAIVKGLADDGGLFVPEYFPDLGNKINDMLSMDYASLATTVMGAFLEEFDKDDLLSACKSAYSKFEDNDPAPVIKINDNLFVLELFHGTTLAFKDVALSILPYLMRKSADYCGIKEQILILVATSGDTGKAALEGFKNAEGIKINVFYPTNGVSDMQKRQMVTQDGENVNVTGVNGNFDDCQTAVKKIFSDVNINEELKRNGIVLSSANSINFGRLLPQIVYYFSTYCNLVNSNEIQIGDKIDFVVPTGNFGNILAGYYAKKMGLPINKLICASNENNVLTEFFSNGTYNKNREFYKTISPSMDILVSSNLERLIFELSERNAEYTATKMSELFKSGEYKISDEELANANKIFCAGYADENDCMEKIKDFFDDFGYVLDTHTAVAMSVYDNIGDGKMPTAVLSTASPFKFSQSVFKAITGKEIKDAFKAADALYKETACEVPLQIKELKEKSVIFGKTVDKDEVYSSVKEFVLK